MKEVAFLVDGGIRVSPASIAVASNYPESARTIERWYNQVKSAKRHDWLALLTPVYAKCGRHCDVIDDSTLHAFIKLYYRPEKPFLSTVHRKLVRAGKQQGKDIPSAKKLKRAAEKKVPYAQRVYMREGKAGLLELYPKQDRSVEALHAMNWINGDGYKHNVKVKFPDGEIVRPTLWVWQDVYSRMIVGWAIDKTENTDIIRKAFLNMAREYGLPDNILVDNTTAAANKELTGGLHHRFRGRVREDEPLGAFPLAGIDCHFTGVDDGIGYAWSKPTERAFGKGGLGEIIDKDYTLRGGYTGRNPMDKPCNYDERQIPLDEFLETVERGIAEYNEQEGRRTEMGLGELSFQDVFKMSYEVTAITRPLERQLRLFEFSSEEARIAADGSVRIRAGQITGKGMKGNNRYGDISLQELAGDKVRVWFNPNDLHSSVDIYSQDGRFICEAGCYEKAGFADREVKREHNRNRKEWMRLEERAAKALGRAEDLEADALLSVAPPDPIHVDTRLVRPFRPKDSGVSSPRHQQTLTPEESERVSSTIVELETELNQLKNAPEEIDRDDCALCVDLYAKLQGMKEEGMRLNTRMTEFCKWFEECTDWIPVYEMMKDDISLSAISLPRGWE